MRRGAPHVLQARREHCHQHCKLQHVICSHPPGSTTRDAADSPRRPLSKRFNFPRPHFAQVVTAMRDHTAAAVQSDAAHRDPHLAHLLPHEQGQVPVLRTPHFSAVAARDMTRCDSQLSLVACGLHSVSLLGCLAVVYLYLTTRKRRRERTAKLLFFLALSGAVLATVTACSEWAMAAACLDHQLKCRREPTKMMAIIESSRILGLHCCGAWTGNIAAHLLWERLLSQGLVSYDFARAQRIYHVIGWGASLVHMQACIALRSAVHPRTASAAFVAFDVVIALFVVLAAGYNLLHSLFRLLTPLVCGRGASNLPASSTWAAPVSLGQSLPALHPGADQDGGGKARDASTLITLAPYALAHAWKLPYNLHGTFHAAWAGALSVFEPGRGYFLAKAILPALHGVLILLSYVYLFCAHRRDNALF